MAGSNLPRLIGMIHLAALPGAPTYTGKLESILERAVGDAVTLADAGFDGLMVENFGDAPFYADDVPKVTVAAMTAAVAAVADSVDIPIGVNVLRNDALAALAVAAATGATMVRVNVLSGTMYTDQGPITGKAAEVARVRASIAPDVAVLADVFVKHAVPPPGLTLVQATHDAVERSGADALVVSGDGTGQATDLDALRTVAGIADPTPVYVGSGADAASITSVLAVGHGAIVGSSLKTDGDPANAVDAELARRFVESARS